MRSVNQGLRIKQTSKTANQLIAIRLGIRSDTHIRDQKITNAIIKQKHLNKKFHFISKRLDYIIWAIIKDRVTSLGRSLKIRLHHLGDL